MVTIIFSIFAPIKQAKRISLPLVKTNIDKIKQLNLFDESIEKLASSNASEEIKLEYRYEIKKYKYFIKKLKEKEKNIYEYVQMRNKQLEVNL